MQLLTSITTNEHCALRKNFSIMFTSKNDTWAGQYLLIGVFWHTLLHLLWTNSTLKWYQQPWFNSNRYSFFRSGRGSIGIWRGNMWNFLVACWRRFFVVAIFDEWKRSKMLKRCKIISIKRQRFWVEYRSAQWICWGQASDDAKCHLYKNK